MIDSDSPRLTFGRFLEDTARRHNGRRAVYFAGVHEGGEGRELLYEELHAEARQLARALIGAGAASSQSNSIVRLVQTPSRSQHAPESQRPGSQELPVP